MGIKKTVQQYIYTVIALNFNKIQQRLNVITHVGLSETVPQAFKLVMLQRVFISGNSVLSKALGSHV